MKKRFLIIVLCLACVASFAQTKKKITTKGKATTKKVAAKPAAKSPAGTSTTDTTKRGAIVAVTPSVAVPTAPAKKFDKPLDGYYKKTNIMNAKVTPYANLRESDVVYSRRVWREIDLREKMNQYMISPKGRLLDVLMDAIANGELTAYDPTPTKEDPDGDEFSVPLSPEKARAKMADSTVVTVLDKNGDKTGSKIVAGEFNPDSVVKFRIKEDWIFDKQRSVEEVRIVGIAPLIKQKVSGANLEFDYQPAFWIYFPAARQVLVTKEVVNHNNDATGLSFDDVFTKRLFASYIVKQSNDKDERIKDYAVGIDRLYESDRIKKSLMDWELNLWQY
jgi:gliding motility associated protien GldN